jgi:hypothetical protein
MRAEAWDEHTRYAAIATTTGSNTIDSIGWSEAVCCGTHPGSRGALKTVTAPTQDLLGAEDHQLKKIAGKETGRESGPYAAPFGRLVVSRESLDLRESREARKLAVFFPHEDSFGQIAIHSDRLSNERETLGADVRRKLRGGPLRIGKESGFSNDSSGEVDKLDRFQPAYRLRR